MSQPSMKITPIEPKQYVHWRKAFAKKYLTSVDCTMLLINSEDTLHLGACGSHPVEHLFARIAHICAGNETFSKILRAAKRCVLLDTLLEELQTTLMIDKRVSDSGVRIGSHDPFPEPITWGQALICRASGIQLTTCYSKAPSLFEKAEDLFEILKPKQLPEPRNLHDMGVGKMGSHQMKTYFQAQKDLVPEYKGL